MELSKLLQRIARGSLANVRFRDMRRLVEAFGFQLLRTQGSHRIFGRPGIRSWSTFKTSAATPYQVRQSLRLVERYGLKLEERSEGLPHQGLLERRGRRLHCRHPGPGWLLGLRLHARRGGG